MSDSGSNRGPQPWGPWVLALGALVIGVVAIIVEGVRVLRRRLRRSD